MYLSKPPRRGWHQNTLSLSIYQCVSISFFTLLRAFQFSRCLGTCARGPAVHIVPRFLSHHTCFPQSYLGRDNPPRSRYLSYIPIYLFWDNAVLECNTRAMISFPSTVFITWASHQSPRYRDPSRYHLLGVNHHLSLCTSPEAVSE